MSCRKPIPWSYLLGLEEVRELFQPTIHTALNGGRAGKCGTRRLPGHRRGGSEESKTSSLDGSKLSLHDPQPVTNHSSHYRCVENQKGGPTWEACQSRGVLSPKNSPYASSENTSGLAIGSHRRVIGETCWLYRIRYDDWSKEDEEHLRFNFFWSTALLVLYLCSSCRNGRSSNRTLSNKHTMRRGLKSWRTQDIFF